MSIINILGFEDDKNSFDRHGLGSGDSYNIFTNDFINNSGYNHRYLYATNSYNSNSTSYGASAATVSGLVTIYPDVYSLMSSTKTNIDATQFGLGGGAFRGYYNHNDNLGISFNVIPSGNGSCSLSFPKFMGYRLFETDYPSLSGAITNNKFFKLNSQHGDYYLYNNNQEIIHSGYMPINQSNSINFFFSFNGYFQKLIFKLNNERTFLTLHDYTKNSLLYSNGFQSDVLLNISPSYSISGYSVFDGSFPGLYGRYTPNEDIKISDIVISNNETFNNHKVLNLKPIGMHHMQDAYHPGTLGPATSGVALDLIKRENILHFGSGLACTAALCNVFTPVNEISGKTINSLKIHHRDLKWTDNPLYNYLNYSLSGILKYSGVNYYTQAFVSAGAFTLNSQVQNFEYNPYTGNNWNSGDISNLAVGASGSYFRMTNTGLSILVSTPDSGAPFDFNICNMSLKTRGTPYSGQLNFYTKAQDCVTTLRPSGDAYIQHPNQWSNTTLWNKVEEDPDFVDDDSDSTQFSQSGNFSRPDNLYYLGEGLRRINLESGTHSTVYNESAVTYDGRLYFNENRNDLLFGTTSLLNYASLDDAETGVTNQDEKSLIDWKTNIGYRYQSTGQITYTLFNSNGTTTSANTSINTAGSFIVYHDIDHKNREVYYVLQDGRLFRQNMNTFAVSGIGTLGISVKADNFNIASHDYQVAAFDFDKKQIFFLPHDGTRSLGIGTTTFSGSIPTYTLIRQKSISPLNESYYDSYSALLYNKFDNELMFSKVNSFTADSGYYKAGIYKTFPSSASGNTTLIKVNQINNTLSSGTAYGLCLDAPRYKSTVEFNLSDIPNDVIGTSLQQFSNVSVKISAKEKVSQAYVTPKIYSSGGNLLWRTDRQSVGFFPSGSRVTRDIGLFNSTLYIANNRTEDWQDAKLRLDIHYPSDVPNKSGELEIYAVEVKAACSGVFQSAPQKTGIFPLYTHGVLRANDSIDLHTLAGTVISQVDLYTAGHLPVSSGVDLFIKYQIAKSGVDLYINGITRHSGSINMSLRAREVIEYNKQVTFVNFGSTKSGVFNTVNMTTYSPTSGDINTSINFSVGAAGTESNTGTMNFMIYAPLKSENKTLNFSITNNWSGLNRSIPMMVKTRSGTPGAVPFSGSVNMFIARAKESAASHIPFYINGPAFNSGLINFITVGETHSSGIVNFHTYAEKDDINATQKFYTHGY